MRRLLIIIFLLSLTLCSNFVIAQITCANIKSGSGGGQFNDATGAAGLGTYCAPVELDWYMTLSAVDLNDDPLAIGGEVFEIFIDWGDGESDIYEAEFQAGTNTFRITNSPNGTTDLGFPAINTAYHKYENETDGVCFYEPIATLRVDGNLCPTISLQIDRPVNYWEPDNTAPGELIIVEDVWEVCAGTTVTLTFSDATDFNCVTAPVPAVSNVSLNDNEREVRIVYGINNDGNTIGDIVVDPGGLNVTNPANYDPNIIVTYPEPVTNASNNYISLDILVPDDALVGEDFFVQLDMWGPCNPRTGPNASAPVSILGQILIVPPPAADPQIFNPTTSTWVDAVGNTLTFCINTNIDFRRNPTNPLNLGGDQYRWDFDNDMTFEQGGANVSNSFGSPGIYTVNMRTRRNTVNDCDIFETFTVEIIETPIAKIGFDNGTFAMPDLSPTYEICASDLPLNLELFDSTYDKSPTLTTRWTIEKMAPTNFGIDDVNDGGPGTTVPFNYPSNPLNITDTGHYQVKLFIYDGSTGCETEDQLDIYIYDTPEATFSATGVCEGETTDFDPSASNIPTIINGDAIANYYWDFSYDSITFNTELTRTDNSTFSQNLGPAGVYSVALIVESDKSCVSDTFLMEVEVYPNPDSDLQAFYGSDFDGNVIDDPYTGDPICPGTLIKFFNNSDEFNNDPSIIDIGYALEIDSVGTTITRSIGDSGTFAMPDIFYNTTGSNVNYFVKLIAIANPADGNLDNNCRIESGTITVEVLPGSASGFNIYEDVSKSTVYDAASSYCSPHEFLFEINNLTNSLLNANDSLIWEIYDGSTQLGGDTVTFGDPNYREFLFEFNNDYPSIAPINYTINLRPFVAGVCVNPSQNTVRVLPKPDSTFLPIDTVYSCDSVTYSFEANQPGLLAYNWDPQPATEVSSSAVVDDKFEVSFTRPGIADPALNVSVTLQTVNPFGCISGVSDPFEDTIQPKDDFTIDLVATGTEICVPAIYNFDNQTIPTDIPANTEWELRITNTDLAITDVIAGSSLAVPDFSAGFDYEFTQAGNYEIRLKALLESNCDLVSDPPITLTLNDSPTMRFRTVLKEGCSPLPVDFIDNSSNPGGADLTNVTIAVQNLTTGAAGQVVSINNQAADFFNGKSITDLVYDDATNAGFNDFAITLTGTNAAGCSDDSTYVVKVFEQPFIDFDIISPNPACEEDYEFEFGVTTFSVPAGTNLTWNWDDGKDTTVTSPNNVKHSFVNRASFYGSDVYNVTLSAQTPNGCITSVSHPVQLNPRIQANFFGDKVQGCSPLNVNFTSLSLGTGLLNNHVYKKRVKGTTPWNNFTATPNNIGSVTETFSNTTGTNITYEVLYLVSSDVGGCLDTAAINEITVFPEFDSPSITGSNTVCAFEQDLEYSVPLTTGSSYLWQLPLGAYITDQNIEGNEITVNFSNFNGNVQVTEINSNGCFGNPSTLPVTVLTGPTVSLALAGPNVICPGSSTKLRFNLTGPGTQGYDVVYNNGITNDTLENIQNGHEITVSPTNSTNYFVLGVKDREYPNCNPSSISGSVFISVNIKPSVTLTGNATTCEGTPTNLFFNLTGIGPWDVVYTDGNQNYSFNTTSPVHLESVSPTANVTYSLVSILDNNSPRCSGDLTGTAEIIVNQKPTAEIFGDQDNICANAPTPVKLNLTGVSPWIVRYTDGTNVFTLNNITPPADYDPATDTFTYTFEVSPTSGVTSYQLIDVRDANSPSCLGDISGSAVIEAFDRPTASLVGNATICNGQSTPITFNTTGSGPFSITYTANNDTIVANNIVNGSTINVSPSTSTVYRIVEVIDVRGCISNASSGPISVNVNQLPTAVLSGADTICFGAQVNLVFDLTGVGPWQITYTNGVNNFTFTTTFNRHFEAISPTNTRTYSIVSITDSNTPNCSNSGTGNPQIVVYPLLDASFTVTPENMELPKSDVDIVNTTTNKNSWNYTWDFGDGTTSNAVDPGNHEYETYGDYVIKMTATNGLCTETFQVLVKIGAIPPIVDFIATPTEGCLPLVVEFENLTQYADPSTYQWEFGDNQRVRAVENPTHVYTSPGVYNVRLVANNITGEEREVIKEEYITVYETPQASFTIPDEFRQVFTGEEVQFISTSVGADQFIWKFGDGNQSFDESPVHVYPDSGVYDITLIAINSITGCQDSFKLDAQVKVILGGDSKIANAFTPSRSGPGSASNNVQSNDIFLPQLKGVSQFNMKIYNRWGELLFETKDKNIGWDGYYKGQLMPQGVYVYRLELTYDNGRRETKVGDLTLIR